jgi:hypothetical protein
MALGYTAVRYEKKFRPYSKQIIFSILDCFACTG